MLEELVKKIKVKYMAHLQRVHESHVREAGDYFLASSAGRCQRMNILDRMRENKQEPGDDLIRMMRVGSLLHEDFEAAMSNLSTDRTLVLPEETVKGVISGAPVKAKVDLGIVHTGQNTAYAFDYKSVGAFGWKKRKNKPHYMAQVATGGILLSEEYSSELKGLVIVFLDRDYGKLDFQEVSMTHVQVVKEFYADLNNTWDTVDDLGTPEPGTDKNPYGSWECKYCFYRGVSCAGTTGGR